MDFIKGKVVAITGSSSGIGKAIAIKLAENGAKVILGARSTGHIVNIISTAGLKITPMMGVYAATKNAVRTIAEGFRQESDGKVRITGISPGFVKTDFAGSIRNEEMRTVIQEEMDQIALDPTAIANAVMYAVSQPDDVEIGEIVIRPSKQN